MGKLRVIFIHGISPAIISKDYAADLRMMIVAQLEQLQVLPQSANKIQIDQVITFDNINYSAIGQTEEERVLEAYRQERSKLFNPIDQALEKLGFERIRREIITAFSDVLVYESEFWRATIRNLVLNKINEYVNNGDAVTLVAHSLGSVVAFDVAYYNGRHNEDWLKVGFKPSNLFTMGSPLALFSLEMDNGDGMQKPRYITKAATPAERNPLTTNPDLQPNRADGVWYNFLDAQDLIGYPLEILFKDKFKVKDILVQTGTDPITAHVSYWRNQDVARRIAQRLKQDYARIK